MPSSAQAPPRPPQQYAPAPPQPKNGLAIAALCCGLVGILVGLIPLMWIAAGALAILAIVFGIVGIRRVGRREATNRGTAIAGLIAGVAAAGMAIAGIAIFFSSLSRLDHNLSNLNSSSGAAQVRDQHVVSHQEQKLIAQDVFIGNG